MITKRLEKIKRYFYNLSVRLNVYVKHNRYPVIHYYFAYIYVCFYVQIGIRLLGFTLDEFAEQACDVSSFWNMLKYDVLYEFYEKSSDYFYRVEIVSIDDLLVSILKLDSHLGFSLLLFPYFISFVTLF